MKRIVVEKGRGIKVASRWNSFEAFLRDMGERPNGFCIDRKDNDGDYEPDNCRWATDTQQQRNRRSNVMLTHNGETLCIAAWAHRIGIRKDTLGWRIRSGWTIEEALTIPTGTRRSSRVAK